MLSQLPSEPQVAGAYARAGLARGVCKLQFGQIPILSMAMLFARRHRRVNTIAIACADASEYGPCAGRYERLTAPIEYGLFSVPMVKLRPVRQRQLFPLLLLMNPTNSVKCCSRPQRRIFWIS